MRSTTPTKQELINAVRDLVKPLEVADAHDAGVMLAHMFWTHEDTINYCREYKG